MAFIQNLFTSRDNNADSATNVGQQGRLWWDPVTNRFYVSDGVTPGGIPVGGGSGSGNSISNGTTNVAIPAANGNVAVTVGGVANTVVFATGNTTFAGNLLPTATNTYTLGTANVQWKSLYVSSNTIYIENNALSADGPNLFWNNDQVIAANATGDINVAAVSATGNITGNYILGNGSQLTGLVSSYNNASVQTFLGSGTLSGNIVPAGNGIVNLGTPTARFGAVYLAGNTIYLGASQISANATAVVITNPAGADFVLQGTLANNSISASGNVVGANLVTAGLITAAGNITGNYILGNGSQLTGLGATYSNAEVVTLMAAFGSNTVSTTGNITAGYFLGNGSQLTGLSATYGNANVAAYLPTYTGNLNSVSAIPGSAVTGTVALANIAYSVAGANVSGQVANALIAGTVYANAQPNITSVGTLSDLTVTGNITGNYISGNGTQLTGILGSNVNMGSNTTGALISNAVTLTTTTAVTNGIALLNQVLGKLVPASPPNFPNAVNIALSGIATYRMANITQVDNTPGANKAVAAGTSVANVLRVATYATNTIANVGPGDSGTITAVRNGVNVGNVTLNTGASPTANGTYGGNLVITNNYDYRVANANIAAGFWYVFSSAVSGTSALAGWNELYIADSATGNTNTTVWYYDNSSPSAPSFSSTTMAPPGSANLLYSSTIPHYTNNNNFTIGFNVANVSGNTYPTSNTLASGSAGGAFAAPSSITYSASNIGSNVLNSFASASANTTASITTGFGGSSTGPSMSVNNSYSTGTLTLTTALGNTVLWKSGTATAIDEANVVIGSTIGTGSGNAFRIVNPGSGNTPAYTSNASAFNSQTSTLETYDSTVVGSGSAGVLKHDQTNYATGHLPAGPNLSAGRSGTQYFTFKFVRTAVSKFDIRYTGTIAGMWVALPGSAIDSSSSANGWIDMSVAYGGAGYPGVNTPGNGSDGCALGGTVTLNSAVTNSSKTCTFGTISSSSTATNEIYVRIALASGQSVTALTLQTASN